MSLIDWQQVRARVSGEVDRHGPALAWRKASTATSTVIWITGDRALSERALLRDLLAEVELSPVLSALDSRNLPLRRRAASFIHDRIATRLALENLAGATSDKSPTLTLSHTHLGQPIICTDDGERLTEHHISFTHDGDAHLCLLARDQNLRGVGIDVVYLPRLRGRSDAYLRRFAGHFMSEEELTAFHTASEWETGEPLLLRAAAHFSLMEAASKAFGTGLKIGAGMGKKESLPKQAVGVSCLAPEVRFLLGPEAELRRDELGAVRLEGHWAADDEYGVSAVLLWG